MSRLYSDMHSLFNSNIIALLNSKQIHTVHDFINTENRILEKISDLTFKEILDIRKALLKKYSSQPKNAFHYYQYLISHCAIIETGVSNLDTLLEGGLFTGNIYEICGLPSAGKTLFCLTLTKNVLLKMKDYVYYLDTKHDFSALKLKRMLDLEKGELVDAMNRVLVKRISTAHDLSNSLFEIKEKIQDGSKIKLVIIDSLPALYLQCSDHTENNSFLNYTSNILHYLAIECNIVIVVTNLITLWNEGEFKKTDVLLERVACGNYWYNVPNVRLKFKKYGDKCSILLMKTMKFLPEICECEVKLTDLGVF